MSRPQSRDRFEDYVPVAERLEKFYAAYPEGRVLTTIVEHDREAGFILMRAEVYRNADDAQPAATGHAFEVRSEGFVQKTSYVEVCECVPIDTEILTINGWRLPDQLAIGDLVMSYDIARDEMVWTPVQRKSFYSKQPLVRLWNPKGFEVFCTNNHTWAIEYKVAQKLKCYVYRKLRATKDFTKVDAIIGSAPMKSGFINTTPRQAALMGWAITDGWFSRRAGNRLRIGIGQSKPKTIEIIRSLMRDIHHTERSHSGYTRTFPTGRTYECLPTVQWDLSAQAGRALLASFGIKHENELPGIVPQLSFEARAAMLEAMMLGDGNEIGRFGCKNRPWVMDVFTMLCALQGHVALKRQYSSVGDIPLQAIKRTKRIWTSSLRREDAGRGDVWCPTVEFGTWVARFSNGVTVLTGNTSCVGRALALLGFEVKRGIASREEIEKPLRMAAGRPVQASEPSPEEHAARLDAEILQSAAALGYDAAKVRKWVNQKFKVTDGLDGLSPELKREVLKTFRDNAAQAQARGTQK